MKYQLAILILLAVNKCYSQQFAICNEESGVDHVYQQLGFIGGGAAFFDADNDGDDDLYVTSGFGMDHFYCNNGDGTFLNKSIEAGFFITSEHYTTAVTVGDINNDGYQDLFVCTRGNSYQSFTKNFLYLNLQDGSFVDIWDHLEDIDQTYSTGASFVDFDNDGLLDIYILNYVDQAGFEYDPISGEVIGYDHTCFDNLLYRNIDGINFERISLQQVQSQGCSLGVCATDIDHDRDMDLLLANDFGEFVVGNKTYKNNYPNISFTEVGSSLGLNHEIYGMGVAHGDYDNDGNIDYYMTNFGSNILLKNENGIFTDLAKETGCDDTWFVEDQYLSVSWGCFFADFNNDSFLDLFVANGWIPSPEFIDSKLGQDDVIFLNDRGESFNRAENLGISNTDVSRGACYSDFDNDGDIDIFVVSQTVPANQQGWSSKLFRNDLESKNYLQVELKGSEASTNAFGTLVEVFYNGHSLIRESISASSHASQNTAILHFGLDTIPFVDSLKIDWLLESQKDTTYYNISTNQRLIISVDSLNTFENYYQIPDSISVDTMVIDTMSMDTMMIDTISNILGSKQKNNFFTFPNPADHCFFINHQDFLIGKEYYFMTTLGRKFTKNIISKECINITHLKAGLYYICIPEYNIVLPFIKAF